MKRNIITSLLIALTAVVGIHSAAQAEDIGQGSIRITLSAEDAADLKVRYLTEDGSVEKSITADEVLKLSSFNVLDNGMDLPELQPKANAFNLEKGETTGFIIMGDNDDESVRLSFINEGLSTELFLDFQWTPKLEVLTSAESKVEVLNEADEVLHELGGDALQITSAQGMAIRFVAPPVEDNGDDQGAGNEDGGNIDLGENQPASGGCSITAATSSSFNLSAMLVLSGLALAARRRLKK